MTTVEPIRCWRHGTALPRRMLYYSRQPVVVQAPLDTG
jgi:hypothetical protein